MLRQFRPTHGAVVALVVLAAIVVVLPWFHAPLSFDEAYNLQVVRNLVTGHGYATDGSMYGGHREMFDYQITTGPTVLLPVAGVTALLGQHIWVYRLVPVGVTVALVCAWYLLVRRSYGELPAVAAGATILMVDNASYLSEQVFGPGSVMGENTSVLLLVLAALSLRRPAGAGVLFGLAVMAKLVVLLGLPGLLLAVVLRARREPLRSPAADGARFLVATAAPALAWQVARVLSVGWWAALHADRDFLSYFTRSGAEAGSAAAAWVRVLEQVAVLGPAGVVAMVLALLVVLPYPWRAQLRRVQRLEPELVAVFGAGVLLELWWLLAEAENWVRHATQATELLAPLLVAAMVRTLARRNRSPMREVMGAAVPTLFVLQIALATYDGWQPPGPSLGDQRHVAEMTAQQGRVFHYPTPVQDFELTLLAPLEARPLDHRGGLTVLSGLNSRPRVPVCDHVIATYADYVICRVKPSG